MNKASGQKASYRGLGSIDFAAAARSVLIVARDKENPQTRVMIHVEQCAEQGSSDDHAAIDESVCTLQSSGTQAAAGQTTHLGE